MRKESPRKGKVVYVARSGPKKGKPDCAAAFETKAEAVDFLTRQHGLDPEEARQLAREETLTLDRRWHGAEICAIEPESMPPTRARQALSGELYAIKVDPATLPTPRAISMKITVSVKLREPKKPRPKRKRNPNKPRPKLPI